MSDFATLLRRHRQTRRWSQELLAARCGIDHSLASRLESDRRAPTRDSLGKLCAGLALSPQDADQLWLASGRLPPDIDINLLGRFIAFMREATTQRAA